MVNSFSARVSFPVFFWPFGGGLASAEIFRRARGHKAALSRRARVAHDHLSLLYHEGAGKAGCRLAGEIRFCAQRFSPRLDRRIARLRTRTLSDLPDGQSTADASKVDVFK
jgi:hypothetical protein